MHDGERIINIFNNPLDDLNINGENIIKKDSDITNLVISNQNGGKSHYF